MVMYGYIYKTTNLVNGKIYVGKHKASEFDEGYKGSGVLLWRAINKYGWSKFKVEFLAPYDSLPDLNAAEVEFIANLDARDRSVGYNIAKGGDGGVLPGEDNPFYGKHHSSETKLHISDCMIKCWESPDYQAKMHELRLGNQNSAGKIWVHYEEMSTRIDPKYLDEFLEEGWSVGCTPSSTEKKRLASMGRQNNLGKIRIHKDGEGRMVDESELQDYLEDGYELGQNPYSVAKRVGLRYSNRTYNLKCRCCSKDFIGNSPRIHYCSDKCKIKYKIDHPGPDPKLVGRKYNLICKKCGERFIASSPNTKICSSCRL